MSSKFKFREGINLNKYDPIKKLLDQDFVAKAIWDCLKSDDPEGVLEILESYFDIVNKTQVCKKTNLSRTTFYKAFKNGNPTLKTLAKLIHGYAEC